MKKMFFTAILIFGSACIFGQSLEPEVIASSGDYYTSDNMTLSWTIGEGITETFSNVDYILTQGFQQSTITITATNEIPDVNYDVNVYPNPASDFINIRVKSDKEESLSVDLFDIHGRKLIRENLINSNTQINLSQISEGIYFLKIFTKNGKLVKSYKIKKSN